MFSGGGTDLTAYIPVLRTVNVSSNNRMDNIGAFNSFKHDHLYGQDILSKYWSSPLLNFFIDGKISWHTVKVYACQYQRHFKIPLNVTKRMGFVFEMEGSQNDALFLMLSKTTNFRLFQSKRADDNFKVVENGRKLSYRVKNVVGKGEIACYEQFLLFPQCFQETGTADTYKPGLVWERVKTMRKETFANIIDKAENA